MARDFDGIDDNVSCPNGGGLNNVQTGTIAAWVRWTGTQDAGFNGFGHICARQENGIFSQHIIGLSTSNPATAVVQLRLYSGALTLESVTTVGDGTWRHIAVTYQNLSQELFMDGVSEGTSAVSGTITNNAAIPLTIGAWTGDGAGFSNADIADFRTWNIRLTAAEIGMVRRGLIVRPDANVGWWELFGTTTPEPDWSGNNNHGTVTGAVRADHPLGIAAVWPQVRRFQAVTAAPAVALPHFETRVPRYA